MDSQVRSRWVEVLRNAREIAEYVDEHSPHDVEREVVEECFHGCRAVLTLLPIGDISPGPEGAHRRIPHRERRYAAMDPATCPPIVVENGVIQDGHHRFRVALKRCDMEIWCYVVDDDEEE